MRKYHEDARGRPFKLEEGETRWPVKLRYSVAERYVFLVVARALGLNDRWMGAAYDALDTVTPACAMTLLVAGVQRVRRLNPEAAEAVVRATTERTLRQSADAVSTPCPRTARTLTRSGRRAEVRALRAYRR